MANTSQRSWRIPYFALWSGQQISLIGSRISQFGLVWWITATTGSATMLAMATLVALLPEVLLAPFVGALVDRWDRKRVMMIADTFVALVSAWLAYLFWSGGMQLWHVYVVVLARAVGGTFHWPAMQASTSLMVPDQHLSRVAGANSAAQGLRGILVPPLGALLVGLMPLHGIMLLDVFTALFGILPLFFVRIPRPRSVSQVVSVRLLWADVRQGLRYVWSWPGLLSLLFMATAINFLLSPAGSLLPILVTKHFGGRAIELGWMNSAWGAGLTAGGLVLSVWGGFRRRIITTLVGLIGLGVGFLAVGLAPASALPIGVIGMLFIGLANPITNGPVLAILQAKVHPEMQGRVFTVVQSLAAGMSPLSMAVAGPVADALGIQVWYIFGGAVCVLIGLVSFFIPVVIHLEESVPPSTLLMEQTPVAVEAGTAAEGRSS